MLPEGERPACIHIDHGLITRVAEFDDVPAGAEIVDAGSLVISPGVVDSHVHVNEPGRADWEGFDTATRAAAKGGVTTIVDMPLNSVPPTVDRRGLAAKRQAASGAVHVDVAFWGGWVPGNAAELSGLSAEVRGFKCFLVPSGVDEFPMVGEGDLREGLAALSRLSGGGRRLLVHAELPDALRAPAGDPRVYATWLATRPEEAEAAAIRMMGRLSVEYDMPTHIVHVSSAEGVEAVARAQADGAPLTAETCPHYLTFAAEDIADEATAFKCAPPLRAARHREALWAALDAGTCSIVASDHSPAPPALKETGGDFITAWGGVASLELSLAAVWTGASARGFGTGHLARWMSEAPARLAGLEGRKGAIRAGADTDLVLWDSEAEFEVRPDRLEQRHKITPYAGRRLRGIVMSTYLRGSRVWHDGHADARARGELL